MDARIITEKIQSLPLFLRREILDYIDFLTKKYKPEDKPIQFSFNWEGGLKEFKNGFTSVELQHKAKDFR